MWLYCQFCLMLAERNHGHPKRRGYAPGASRANSTVDISNMYPSITMVNFRNSPKGQIDLVSARHNQNGHTSQFVMPRWVHVALLMTLMLELLSTMPPEISCPCKRILMAGFCHGHDNNLVKLRTLHLLYIFKCYALTNTSKDMVMLSIS